MSIFCYKKIDPALRLGEQFRRGRETRQLSLETAATETRIPLKYLTALEQCAYTALPKARSHRLAYIKEYARYLGLPPGPCLGQFHCEDGLEDTPPVHPHRTITLFPFSSISIFLRNSILVAAVIFFAAYLFWQVKGILEPPYLMVFAPEEGRVFTKPQAIINGETKSETSLKVNGREIMVNEQGKFETSIDLTSGVNTIIVSATKKHGKTTTITRHVVVKPRTGSEEQLLQP